MDVRERVSDSVEASRAAIEGTLARVHTSLPGIIDGYDEEKMTCSIRPAVKMVLRSIDKATGAVRFDDVEMPLLQDVPVIFPRAGGFVVTFPVKEGDECLVVFSERCIDAWWQNGGVQPQAELRMHDLSDGFAILGPSSQQRLVSDISTDALEIRSDAGDVFVRLSSDEVKISAPKVKVHAGVSYAWDVHGYGERLTWTGGSNYTRDTYYTGATVSTNSHGINPPEIP